MDAVKGIRILAVAGAMALISGQAGASCGGSVGILPHDAPGLIQTPDVGFSLGGGYSSGGCGGKSHGSATVTTYHAPSAPSIHLGPIEHLQPTAPAITSYSYGGTQYSYGSVRVIEPVPSVHVGSYDYAPAPKQHSGKSEILSGISALDGRIEDGEADGSLTGLEARELRRHQRALRRALDHADADHHVCPIETGFLRGKIDEQHARIDAERSDAEERIAQRPTWSYGGYGPAPSSIICPPGYTTPAYWR